MTWRNKDMEPDIESIDVDVIKAPEPRDQENRSQLTTPPLLSQPPTDRNDEINTIPTSTLLMINTGLSLNLDQNNSTRTTPRLEYAERITGIIDTPSLQDQDGAEFQALATSTPRTRNGGVRKGVFDRDHHFRQYRS